jgi:dTDP-4-dehydrorhamnose reductase
MSQLLIVGAGGMLGSEVYSQLRAQAYEIECPSSTELDIRNLDLVESYIGDIKPDWIINCAAWTRVDDSENFPNLAREVNEVGVRNIAQTASKFHARLIHISTDYVFDGRSNVPYAESDQPNPINEYGLSKYLGEQSIKNVNSQNSFIVRTSWLYGENGNNFVNTMVHKALKNELVKVVDDQVGSPTSSRDLAKAVDEIFKHTPEPGIYHYSNLGECSWFEFAQEIYALVGADVDLVEPIPSKSLNLRASRPTYSVLSKDKWIKSGLSKPPHWKQSLNSTISSLLETEK